MAKKARRVVFRDGPREVREGDVVYVQNVNKGSREARIDKVGLQLIHLDTGQSFYLNGEEKSRFNHNSLFSSRQAFDEHREKVDLIAAIEGSFSYIGGKGRKLGLSKLKRIMEIIEEEDN